VESNLVLCRAYRNLGDAKAALARGNAAVAQARRLAPGPSALAKDRALLAHSLVELGDSLADDHRPDDAARTYGEALSLLEALSLADEAGLADRGHLVRVLTRQADQAFERGSAAEARSLYERAFAAGSALLAAEPGSVDYSSIHATAVERLGDVSYYLDQDTAAACERYRAALELRRRTAGLAPDDPAVLRGLAIAMQNVAWCAEERKAWAEARPLYEESVGIQRRLLALDPHNTVLAPQLMGGLGQTGNVLRLQGDLAQAVTWYDEAVHVGTRFRDEGRSTPGIDAKTADIAELDAEALLRLGRTAEARRALELAERIVRDLVVSDPKNVEYTRLSEETDKLRRRLGGRALATGATR
jgi:tetratricopeptide (TPR) repeat protein